MFYSVYQREDKIVKSISYFGNSRMIFRSTFCINQILSNFFIMKSPNKFYKLNISNDRETKKDVIFIIILVEFQKVDNERT